MPITFAEAFVYLWVALLCGALIGTERQARGRMAGLRTNALVALGAAGFVVYSGLYPNEIAQTRVAAQVVSGIGFLGAGLMFRHGFEVHGLNTAATLWCSASVGVLAGAGAIDLAALLTVMIGFINLGLRPIVRWIKRHRITGDVGEGRVRLRLRLFAPDEADIRRLALTALGAEDMSVAGLSREVAADDVVLTFLVGTDDGDPDDMRRVIAALLSDPRILGADLVVEPAAGT